MARCSGSAGEISTTLNPVKYELDCVKYIADGVELSTDWLWPVADPVVINFTWQFLIVFAPTQQGPLKCRHLICTFITDWLSHFLAKGNSSWFLNWQSSLNHFLVFHLILNMYRKNKINIKEFVGGWKNPN